MSRILSRRAILLGTAGLGAGAALSSPAARSAAATTVNRRSQLAFLNHSYTVFDTETADAIATNDYLREFGAFDLRTTTNGDSTYSGRYLLGRQTYLEMFAEGDLPAPDDARGVTGLAHSPDRAGTIETIKRRMIDLGATTPLDAVQTKLINGAQIPWFRVVAPSTSYVASFPWVMEYLESYFDDPRTHSEPASFPGDVSRERFNPDGYQTKLMRDVVGVEFGAPSADLTAISTTLRASGLRVRSRPSGLLAGGKSESLVVHAVPRAEAGWQRVLFELNCEVRRRHIENIGRSRLSVGPGHRAVWSFDRESR